MSGSYGSPEIDCNCDEKTDVSSRSIYELPVYVCDNCGKKWNLCGTNQDDLTWEEAT